MNSNIRFVIEERVHMRLLFLIIVLLYIIFTPVRFVLQYIKPELFKHRATTSLYSLLRHSNA